MSKNRDLANNYDNSVVDAKLNKADNLNDLPNKATARTNLGLSTGATSTVTTSTTDTTAGRLLKVGDFGVGGTLAAVTHPIFGTDINNYVVSGSYFARSDGGWLNAPTAVLSAGILQVIGYEDRIEQTFKPATQNRIFVRNLFNTWSPWQEIYHTGSNTLAPTTGALTVGTNDASSLTLKTNNTGRVTVDSAGNVGIGGTPLNVLGGGYEGKTLKIGLTGLLMGGDGEEVTLASNFYYDGQSRAIVGGRGSSYVSQYQGAILFNTAPPVTNSNDPITATTAMTIANNGNVGIGTSSPDNSLVVNSGAVTSTLKLQANTGINPTLSFLRGTVTTSSISGSFDGLQMNGYQVIRFDTATIERLRITYTGNVLIGTTTELNPTDKLQVNGSIRCTTLTQTSDYSLKTNIEHIHSASVLLNLKPREYTLNSDGRKHYGFIAQELADYLPILVSGSDGSKSVNYIELIPLLVKAIQELSQEVETLKGKQNEH